MSEHQDAQDRRTLERMAAYARAHARADRHTLHPGVVRQLLHRFLHKVGL